MERLKHLLNANPKSLLAVALFILLGLCSAFSFTEHDDFDSAREGIMLRAIGHKILLQSGDSTSRVLPVTKIAENSYQIRFERAFTFHPDSVVKIVSRALAENKSASDYVVNVLDCTGKEVIFGYSISEGGKSNLVPCSGRKREVNCYRINLIFKNNGITNAQKGYLIGGLPLLAFIGLMISKSFNIRKRVKQVNAHEDTIFTIGSLTFDAKKRQLSAGEKVTELTAKENKLLLIFAKSPNLIIERSRLQKEIWEDEGVIVGRSLDVFISKLRRKLEQDPTTQLTNIHGKGYRLQTAV